ncbi:hypothetical protein MPSEU_000829700 [Mayamaea pseudoterrestris]|nr:hypothetical protein MPSEU_000829700 [Mayamaea pseudoterrestris]
MQAATENIADAATILVQDVISDATAVAQAYSPMEELLRLLRESQLLPNVMIKLLAAAYQFYQDAFYYLCLFASFCLLIVAYFVWQHIRPLPGLPLKKLPKRPLLSVLFQPDDITGTRVLQQQRQEKVTRERRNSSSKPMVVTTTKTTTTKTTKALDAKHKKDDDAPSAPYSDDMDDFDSGKGFDIDDDDDLDDDDLDADINGLDQDVNDDDDSLDGETPPPPQQPFFSSSNYKIDMPDSFAPLLSSSHVEVLLNQLTADLIHGAKAEATIRLRPGQYEIPLDKDSSRPQLTLQAPEKGCKVSVLALVGSDRLTTAQDLSGSIATSARSQTMVKAAGLVLDPPLALLNVAPTLIHFPTLFQDVYLQHQVRKWQLLRWLKSWIVSLHSWIEKFLWILESKCQIHLSKITIRPIYQGRQYGTWKWYSKWRNRSEVPTDAESITAATPGNGDSPGGVTKDDDSNDWRLSLSFSGHVLLWNWIPIPFINIVLPTFIIPQPHALLHRLCTTQPLASAKVRRELIAEQRIAIAALEAVDAFATHVKVMATPPAVGIDITLPGGLAVAMELGLGRDPYAGQYSLPSRAADDLNSPSNHGPGKQSDIPVASDASLSSWTTKPENTSGLLHRTTTGSFRQSSPFDANQVVPWLLEFQAKGTVNHDKLSIHILKCSAKHEEVRNGAPAINQLSVRGNMAVWKLPPGCGNVSSPVPMQRKVPAFGIRRRNSNPVVGIEDTPAVAAVLLFPEETEAYRQDQRMLKYDYSFDVAEDSRIDAITLSVGASHMMLNGGTMMTFILENLYAFGTFAARDDAVLDPIERHRKRNILRHLPATDFAAGVQNVYIPVESNSYSDDGLTLFVPSVDGGRLHVRMLGGFDENAEASIGSHGTPLPQHAVSEGVKLLVDFELPSLVMNTEGIIKEYPELDIFDGVKLRSHLSGVISGSIRAHLRPQVVPLIVSSTGPNIFNPLEAYEIDCSGSSMAIKIKEYTATLGHRRVVFPAESTVTLQIIESVVDMGFEGRTRCELGWDFQGLSPILQVTKPGVSPGDADPEQKEQVSLLINALRQGRLSLNVSPVGGITIKQAATAREDKDGLYDWKFFNALVSPDDDSLGRLIDVLHDKRTTDRVLQVAKLISSDLHRILKAILEQVWKFKETLDVEGIKEAKDGLPANRLACIVTRFVTGDVADVNRVLPIIEKIVSGEGLDIAAVKDLLREHVPETYQNWSPEIDRVVRWAAVMSGPVAAAQPYVEEKVPPLAELPHYASRLRGIPSAQELYERTLDKPHMPLDPSLSQLVGNIAPYLTFRQIEFFLEARDAGDWQANDLRRLRYVYSIKRKVLDIAESYGGLSFLPQSFLVSVFLGEATRTSLRASLKRKHKTSQQRRQKTIGQRSRPFKSRMFSSGASTLSSLRSRRGSGHSQERTDGSNLTAAERAAGLRNFDFSTLGATPENLVLELSPRGASLSEVYELGDSLLGPQDVAILLQAGLTSVMKASTVVQLNQRMLLDLICSQSRTFAVAVLAEIGSTGSPRGLTSALMSLLELDQTAFKPSHKVDMHALLESWLPGLSIPRREDYLAGGRWARQSYYEALYSVASSILEEAELYSALKGHIQRVRRYSESDPIPAPREGLDEKTENGDSGGTSRLKQAIQQAKSLIAEADQLGFQTMKRLQIDEQKEKQSKEYANAIQKYHDAFEACAKVRDLDKHSFHARWFRQFYKRNYDALTIKSLFDNVIDDVDNVRYWLHVLRSGSRREKEADPETVLEDIILPRLSLELELWTEAKASDIPEDDEMFLKPENHSEQVLLDAIIDAVIYEPSDREKLRKDPLVRLLIDNSPGHYNFNIVSAMGVVTEGKKGTELALAYKRLEEKRGIKVIRADTATARSLEYNAGKIEEAIEEAIQLGKPYGYIGYSQGCANALLAESTLLTGTPKQQHAVTSSNAGLVCRMLCFSAANGSFHGPAMEKKIERLIVLCEEFFKYQQGYVSRSLTATILENINTLLDSSTFHKIMGGAQSFLPDGCRAFWREAQHLATVPTCTIRGVMEEHTTPEALELMRNLMTKQSGSALHDSQVHVFDAVGHPIYYRNRNGCVLEQCDVGNGCIQRTHHWSPLEQEVEFLRTTKDIMMASYDCAKDRHVAPWVEVNARFGFIKYADYNRHDSGSLENILLRKEVHSSKLVQKEQTASTATG